MERMKLLATIVKQCGRLRGGALISAVYGFLHHGDPGLSATVKALLTTVCKPMYNMILKWIFDGTLEDPFTEFFIAADVQVMNQNEICQRTYLLILNIAFGGSFRSKTKPVCGMTNIQYDGP